MFKFIEIKKVNIEYSDGVSYPVPRGVFKDELGNTIYAQQYSPRSFITKYLYPGKCRYEIAQLECSDRLLLNIKYHSYDHDEVNIAYLSNKYSLDIENRSIINKKTKEILSHENCNNYQFKVFHTIEGKEIKAKRSYPAYCPRSASESNSIVVETLENIKILYRGDGNLHFYYDEKYILEQEGDKIFLRFKEQEAAEKYDQHYGHFGLGTNFEWYNKEQFTEQIKLHEFEQVIIQLAQEAEIDEDTK